MLFYFVTLAVLGVIHISAAPGIVLETLNPLTRSTSST
jgi:K+ transporter